jgi:DNA-binding NtrC family response regulator
MSADPAEAIEAVRRRPQRRLSTDKPLGLSLAQGPLENSGQRLVDLAHILLREAEMVARVKDLTEGSKRLEALNVSETIDLYDEVRRFEISLIKLALDKTGGHQANAARLLNVSPTTLNTKIKVYGIEY